MKKICLLILVLFFGSIAYSSNKPFVNIDKTVEYNFSEQSQFIPSRILYKYILNDLNKTAKEAKNFANITPKSVRAFAYDLNDDGKKEIIGVVYSSLYFGSSGYSLFILKKQKDKYKHIDYLLNFEPSKEIYILPDKKMDYKNIKFYGSNLIDFKLMTAEFNRYVYYNREQYKTLRKYMIDYSNYDVSEITDK